MRLPAPTLEEVDWSLVGKLSALQAMPS